MDTLQRLMDIASRLEQLESNADWIARETVHTDSGVSQSATLITVLSDNVRERIYALVKELEDQAEDQSQYH
jgi:hypothetical protein